MGIVESVISRLIASRVSRFVEIMIESKFFSNLPLTAYRLDDQNKLYKEVIEEITKDPKPPSEVVFIHHSGQVIQYEICNLLKSGINVELYQQSPGIDILSQSDIRNAIEEVPRAIRRQEQNTNFKGKLTIRRLHTPVSLRAFFVEDKLLILSWYNYYTNNSRELRIVGSENPGILVRKGSRKFMELREMIRETMNSHRPQSNDGVQLSDRIIIYE